MIQCIKIIHILHKYVFFPKKLGKIKKYFLGKIKACFSTHIYIVKSQFRIMYIVYIYFRKRTLNSSPVYACVSKDKVIGRYTLIC